MITGELPYNQKYLSYNQIFDNNLLKAINTFRTKTGQYIDEEIGNNTIRALNYTFTDYVNKNRCKSGTIAMETSKTTRK